MIFLGLPQKDLMKILAVCNQVSPKRNEAEVFTFTKVLVTKENVKFEAINSSSYYTASVSPLNLDLSEEAVEFLVKTEVLTSSVALITDEIVSFEVDLEKSNLFVQGPKSKHTLRINTDLLADFVAPVENLENLEGVVTAKSNELSEAIKSSFIAVGQAKNVYEPKFLNVCFTVNPNENKFFIVSTDRYRVSKTKVEATFSNLKADNQEVKNYLVLPKGLQFLLAAVGSEAEISLNFYSDLFVVAFGQQKLILHYGEGNYPDYDKIIPQSFTCSFILSSKDLQDGLKQVYLFARSNTINKSVSVKIDPTEKKLILSSTTDEGYASEANIGLQNYEGPSENWSQSFNADYLLEYVSGVKTENILWESNPGKPSVLSPENERERQIYLVSGLK
ncbi:MAG: DNA polymerase III subunit beta [bacterium]